MELTSIEQKFMFMKSPRYPQVHAWLMAIAAGLVNDLNVFIYGDHNLKDLKNVPYMPGFRWTAVCMGILAYLLFRHSMLRRFVKTIRDSGDVTSPEDIEEIAYRMQNSKMGILLSLINSVLVAAILIVSQGFGILIFTR